MINRSSRSTALLAPLVASVALVLASCGGGDAPGASTPSPNEEAGEAASETRAVDEVLPSDIVLGEADAPVTIVEYASTTCPACASFHRDVFPALNEKFVKTGKAKFIFREFPTSPVELSLIGSVFARCTAEDGGPDVYFNVLKSLFNDQRDWIYGDDPKASLLKIAAQTGMDEAAFDACLREQKYVDVVEANVDGGRRLYAVRSTPTIFINGEKARDRSPEALAAAIEDALAAGD